MKNTTLCYIEKDGAYLMLHRNKKKNDDNEGKWIGVGGKFEEGESPEECLLREVKEETGLTLVDYRMRGIVTFVSDVCPVEYMFLYTSTDFEGEMHECDEGELCWVKKERIPSLNLWQGDAVFLSLLAAEHPFFSLKLCYKGDRLIGVTLDGRTLSL